MSLKTVSTGLRTYINANFAPCEATRCYLLPSETSYLLMSTYATPGVGIVYTGGDPALQKNQIAFNRYQFDIFIWQTIWNEEAVMEGMGTQLGLLEMHETLVTLLDGYKFGDVVSITVTKYYGPKDYAEIGTANLSANIGFQIEVREQIFT